MPTKVSAYRSGEPRFGTRSGKDYVNGEVKTYKLSDEELQKLRKETGFMELTKQRYMELKAAGKTDKAIMQEYDLNPVKLNQLKRRWDLIGVFQKKSSQIVERVNKMENVPDTVLSTLAENFEDEAVLDIVDVMVEQTPSSDTPFRKIALSIAETLEKKNHDYGDSFKKLYDEFGDLSAAIRLTDKLERYKTLIRNEQKVADESIDDTLMDLAGYAILTIMARKKL